MKKLTSFPKTPTGINGLDEITQGGFPKGRPVLVCGSAGCGKTLMAAQFLVKGITEYDEPGVFMSFEETAADLSQNVASLGFDLEKLKKENKLRVDFVRIERSEIEETGEYDLEGLFIRLNHAIDSIGAKRVVLDTIESIFSGIDNLAMVRSEIRRLFGWLKEKGVTAVITGERGESTLTRQGLEEYVSDCVILLDFRVIDQIATRRLRIVKYRGSTHGTNEYPFLIDEEGISVIPITSLQLDYKSPTEFISTGLPALDNLFSGKGIYRGGSTLITGTAGTAKTIIASYFAKGSCARKEKTLYFSFEESPEQLVRNMESIGIDLRPLIKSKLLHIHASRPSLQGLEMHLLVMNKLLAEIKPKTVIVDPISSLVTIGNAFEVRAMLVRLMDTLKMREINSTFTSLTHNGDSQFTDATVDAVSSLADTWIRLTNDQKQGTRDRKLYIVKSRGMGHANSEQNFNITTRGIEFSEGN
ncbi:circadian clock protein KaiC [Flavobacterium wongokense]|uniref:circadian clock protein KaiC n=1 Tax=Flavobacterium wongokense TaxID=2910674 RepID=UPI001F2DF0E9|nr:circadian clock protein KaiC [Flavobacterium sp. WG47]MCF6131687.1 circadian clock protein KaiC [Flavobacterium sp. WG47]